MKVLAFIGLTFAVAAVSGEDTTTHGTTAGIHSQTAPAVTGNGTRHRRDFLSAPGHSILQDVKNSPAANAELSNAVVGTTNETETMEVLKPDDVRVQGAHENRQKRNEHNETTHTTWTTTTNETVTKNDTVRVKRSDADKIIQASRGSYELAGIMKVPRIEDSATQNATANAYDRLTRDAKTVGLHQIVKTTLNDTDVVILSVPQVEETSNVDLTLGHRRTRQAAAGATITETVEGAKTTHDASHVDNSTEIREARDKREVVLTTVLSSLPIAVRLARNIFTTELPTNLDGSRGAPLAHLIILGGHELHIGNHTETPLARALRNVDNVTEAAAANATDAPNVIQNRRDLENVTETSSATTVILAVATDAPNVIRARRDLTHTETALSTAEQSRQDAATPAAVDHSTSDAPNIIRARRMATTELPSTQYSQKQSQSLEHHDLHHGHVGAHDDHDHANHNHTTTSVRTKRDVTSTTEDPHHGHVGAHEDHDHASHNHTTGNAPQFPALRTKRDLKSTMEDPHHGHVGPHDDHDHSSHNHTAVVEVRTRRDVTLRPLNTTVDATAATITPSE